MSYRDELRAHYDEAERIRETAEQWMDIIESGELSHAMVIKLVRERDDLLASKTQLEEALDTRQQVYDKLLNDYTKLLVKCKNAKLHFEHVSNFVADARDMLK